MIDIRIRKSRDSEGNEYILVDRSAMGTGCRYVVATANPQSLAAGEWFWGHYFATEAEAVAFFASLPAAASSCREQEQ